VGLPRVFDAQVTCPAGAPIGEALRGSGCACRVVQEPVLSSTDPSSLVQFCLADYCLCPTWRAEKEAIWARKDVLGD
jgi:hypothetical protein